MRSIIISGVWEEVKGRHFWLWEYLGMKGRGRGDVKGLTMNNGKGLNKVV
jgi:hypothetical protein